MTQYTRHAVVSIDEVLRQVFNQWVNGETSRAELSCGFEVGVTSLRMRTFARAVLDNRFHCVTCGCKPQFFSVDTFTNSKDQKIKHTNLIGLDGENEILFTHDHILARSLGGADNLKNTQLMCSPCNSLKSIDEGKARAAILKAKSKKKVVNKS